MRIISPRRVSRFRRIAGLVAFGVLLSLFPLPAEVVLGASARIGEASRAELSHAPNHVVVEIAHGADSSEVLGEGSKPVMGRWYFHPVLPGKTPIETVEAILSRPGVETAELDYRVQLGPHQEQEPVAQAQASSVNDPLHKHQWHFPAVRADEGWPIGTGGGVVVAVVDSGVSKGGEDLECHTFVAPYNAITETPGLLAASDDNGHGTHVAGTIAQCTNNGVGVAGVAFDASLMPVKVLDQTGSGEFSWIARGIDWARDNGADVINMSLGCDGCTSSMMNDAIEAARAAGVVIVAASGNSGLQAVSYPASHPDVIAVGATDYDNQRAPYSNWGSGLDLVAPGGDVFQDANEDGYGDGVLQETFTTKYGWGYYFLQGTSMATPHVAGAAALLLSVDPGLDPGQVQQILEDTALDLGAKGFDTTYGHGQVQICDAVGSLVTDNTTPKWPGSAQLGASNITSTSVKLTWERANDDICVRRYRIYRGETFIKTTAASQTTTTITGLKPATDYTFEVRAADVAGNLSQPLSVDMTTLDTIAPVWAESAQLSVLSYGETSLKLAWSAAVDDIGVTGYRIRLSGTTGFTTTSRQATFSGLQPGSEYVFEVLAGDTAGNWSPPLEATVRTARAFTDAPGHTFYNDILWMSGMDITRGCNPPNNDFFCPDDPVTRGQMAAFLVRALGVTANSHPGFDDVVYSNTFHSDIGTLATAAITRGCNPPNNDLYCPDDPVTRAQMAAFVVRALELTSNSHPGFDDVASANTFYDDIGKLATEGITRGCNPPGNNRYCPNDPITRGELAAFLHRALGS